MFRRRPGARWLPLLAMTWAAIGCDSYSAYCEKALACQNPNEADLEACIINQDAEEDVADVNGCADQYNKAFECRDTKGRCVTDAEGHVAYQSGDVCKAENDLLGQCIN
jgi:hypothetical protein